MNTQQFQLRLEPREELAHLVNLTAGMFASNQCVPSAGPHVANGGHTESILGRDAARQLLEQLRWDVERRVEEFPERYVGLAEQMPIA